MKKKANILINFCSILFSFAGFKVYCILHRHVKVTQAHSNHHGDSVYISNHGGRGFTDERRHRHHTRTKRNPLQPSRRTKVMKINI